MKNLSKIILMIFLSSFNLYSQENLQWSARYNGTANFRDEGKAVATDLSGNIYVAGSTFNLGTFEDFTLVKYNSIGGQLWSAVYNGLGNRTDIASFIAIDVNGNIYISGLSTGVNSSFDYVTIKYNSNGNQQWVAVFNGLGNAIDYPTSLTVDASENVYVTGQSYGGSQSSYDFATVKYNSTGVMQWVSRFDGAGNGNDEASSLKVDNSGNVFVTGTSFENSVNSSDYVTIKYNSFGNQEWISKYNGPGSGIDASKSLQTDFAGNIYVTGYSRGSATQYDFATIKYNSSGAEQWVARYNGTVNGNDGANSMAIDNLGNIIVSGYTTTNGISNDFATIKYNSSGIPLWLRTYNGSANQNDSSVAIAVDVNNNICVTGFSTGIGTAKDFTTIKYNPDGSQDWIMRFNSVNNGEDISNSIVIDLNGDVYVTGKSPTEESNDDILTLKYSSITGIEQTFTGNVNQYILYNNYPNPFNPSTQISFNIPKESFVKLKIYDISGKEVQTLVNSVLEPGYHKVSFSPINSSSNIYFYRLETDQFVQTKKMIFIK